MIISPDGSQFLVASPFFSSGAQTEILALQDGRVLSLFNGFTLGQSFQGAFLIDGVSLDPETGVSDAVFSIERGERVFTDNPQAVELTDGRIAVIWGEPQGNQISAPNNLIIQVFSSDFSTASPPQTIIEGAFNPNGAGGQYDIAALPNGGFAVTWIPFLGLDLLPQDRIQTTMLTLFDADANTIGSNIDINPEASVSDTAPKIAVLADGSVVVGTSRFQLVSGTGELIGDKILLPDPMSDSDVLRLLSQPEIAALAGGGFALVWTEVTGRDNVETTRIFAQIYDASGLEVAGVITIDTQPEAFGAQFSITALSTGGFVVAYTETNDSGPDVSGTAINAAVVSSGGEVRERDILVNEAVLGDQDFPFVVETTGGFTVVWHDDEQFGGGRDIFGRTFDVAAEVTTTNPGGGGATTGGDDIATNGDDRITGTNQNDTINALAGNDNLNGLAGDDLLLGGGGDDSIKGAAGDDRLRGNGGEDTLKGGGGDDNIKGGGGGDVIRGNGGNDVIRAGGAEDNVKGGGGADRIFGGGGADQLNGGGGADTLRGNGGDDTLKGNGGADVFQFRTSDRNDTISDFRQGQDKIQIQNGAQSFEALTIEQDGRDVLIGFGAGQVRVVTDSVGAFDESDFIF